jgi:hypothetical protein
MQDTVDAITQLATATASDRGTVANIDHNQCQTCHSTRGRPRADFSTQERDRDIEEQDQTYLAGTTTKTTNNDSYCWSHDYQVAKSHTSATCNMKKSGHQDAANNSNTMGGVQWGKE